MKVIMKINNRIFAVLAIVTSFLFLSSCVSTYQQFQPPAVWETFKLGKTEFENYLYVNSKKIHFIEGIWQVSVNVTLYSNPLNLTKSVYNAHMADIAIIRENINNPNETKYLIVMMKSGNTDWNYPGRIKGRIYKINSNTYSIDWYNERYNLVRSNFHINSYSEITGTLRYTEDEIDETNEFTFTKVYPQDEKAQENEEKVSEDVEYTGSGILISREGLVITNNHIVENARKIIVDIPSKNISKYALGVSTDKYNDVVVLQLLDFQYDSLYTSNIPVSFADLSKTKLGQSVFSIGYPLGSILGNTPRVSNGIINSLYGIKDDPRLFQISNPIQPGNSGSPLFNSDGEILGLVVASLDAKYFYDNLGIVPQNVNFAIKNTVIKTLLKSLQDANISNKNLLKGIVFEKQIEKISPYILQIKAYRKAK